jgi:hypothetical protein
VLKAQRRVSDQENVSYRTVQRWHYEEKKRLRLEAEANQVAAQAKAKPSVRASDENSESPAGLFRLSEPLAPDPPPYLDMDNGQMSCSRCRGNHIEYRMDCYHCNICGVLEFSGFTEDMEIKTFDNSLDPWSWMC